MTKIQQSNLYWTGGAFHTGLMIESGQFAEAVLSDAVKISRRVSGCLPAAVHRLQRRLQWQNSGVRAIQE